MKKLRILISNDDGIHAPGLEILTRIARALSDDVWVVAPDTEQSGAAHSLTLNLPLRLHKWDDRRFSVNGTPTDSVMVAVFKLLKDHKPDLVLSGINSGGNLAEDVTYSGTVAAAMEATILGIPAIAFSQQLASPGQTKWETAEAYAPGIIQLLVENGWPAGTLININFPDTSPENVNGVKVVRQGNRDIDSKIVEWQDPRGRPYYWIGIQDDKKFLKQESDIAAINDNFISITPLHLDLTEYKTLDNLRKLFDDKHASKTDLTDSF